jgi:hypothetical protein
VSLLFRCAVYALVLFLVAIVVVGQRHATAKDTLRAALPRTGRWLLWSFALVGAMFALEALFIGW